MQKYRVQISGSVYVEAENPDDAMCKALEWAMAMHEELQTRNSVGVTPSLAGIQMTVDDKHVLCVSPMIDDELAQARGQMHAQKVRITTNRVRKR